ncbi:MAG: hypothetical protein V4644_00900 [Patescibacteria group bacterium]
MQSNALVANDQMDFTSPEMVTTSLIAALALHGFIAEAVDIGSCDDESRPCIPLFRFSGGEDRKRLTNLVLEFYDSTQIPDKQRDTTLNVERFDRTVDGELEFDYQLSFDGFSTLALLPREIFDLTPDLGRSISERYFAKLTRFTDFLNHRSPD